MHAASIAAHTPQSDRFRWPPPWQDAGSRLRAHALQGTRFTFCTCAFVAAHTPVHTCASPSQSRSHVQSSSTIGNLSSARHRYVQPMPGAREHSSRQSTHGASLSQAEHRLWPGVPRTGAMPRGRSNVSVELVRSSRQTGRATTQDFMHTSGASLHCRQLALVRGTPATHGPCLARKKLHPITRPRGRLGRPATRRAAHAHRATSPPTLTRGRRCLQQAAPPACCPRPLGGKGCTPPARRYQSIHG